MSLPIRINAYFLHESIRKSYHSFLKKRVVSAMSRYAYRAGPLTLNHQAHKAPSLGRFFVPAALIMVAGIGHPSGWPVPGPVLATLCQPSPNQQLTDRDGFQTYQESEMSQTPPPVGLIRPISFKALEKRVRLALARDGLMLRRNRPGTMPFAEYGPLHVEEPKSRSIIRYQVTLEEIAMDMGLISSASQVLDGNKKSNSDTNLGQWVVAYGDGSISSPYPTEEEAQASMDANQGAIYIARSRMAGGEA